MAMTDGSKEIVAQLDKNGVLPREARLSLDTAMKRLAGRVCTISVKTYTKKRSNEQSRFYWGVVVPMVKEMFEEAGNVVDSDEVHCFLRAHVGKLVNRIVMPDGTTKNVLKSSTKLTTMEFEDYLTKVRVWAAEQGVVIPLPREELSA